MTSNGADEVAGLPEEADGLPDEVDGLPEEADCLPDEADCLPDEVDGLPEKLRFDCRDGFCLVVSIVMYLLDVGGDAWLAYRFFVSGHHLFFAMTIGVVVFGSLVLTVLSWEWYKDDDETELASRRDRCLRTVFLLLQLAPVLRYGHALEYGFEFRAYLRKRGLGKSVREADAEANEREAFERMLRQEADARLLCLVERFVDAGPQVLLQFYILVRHGSTYAAENPLMVAVQVGSIVLPLVSMSWAMSAYSRSARFAHSAKQNLSRSGTLVHFFWHLFVPTARVLALGLFASAFRVWVFVVVVVHVGVSWVWVAFVVNTTVCFRRVAVFDWRLVFPYYKEASFDLLVALVYLFQYLNVKDEPTRRRYAAFYALAFAENAMLVAMWFASVLHARPWYAVPAFLGHFLAFALGIVFMLAYYLYFHPGDEKIGSGEEAGSQLLRNEEKVTGPKTSFRDGEFGDPCERDDDCRRYLGFACDRAVFKCGCEEGYFLQVDFDIVMCAPNVPEEGGDLDEEEEEFGNVGGIGDGCTENSDCKGAEHLACNEDLFQCECAEGYVMDEDMLACVAESPAEPEAVYVKLVATKMSASKKTQQVSLEQTIMTWSSGPSLVGEENALLPGGQIPEEWQLQQILMRR
ncbi:unnamed protein product [Darwinula stevensoni]|uniref:XK-related protein n=1 Tax=Darwinula stevensoni TaxID=69355 RepID=A0A7R8X4W1_9CRUS|nr:unnamed protein product [Darwinula stevensoni]CAG0880175.1 unnamed protein product [Darwinula stevensoni]